jgi:CheY-like chemotaxis protein
MKVKAHHKNGDHMSLSNKRLVDQDHSSLTGVRVLVVEDTWHVAKAQKSALEQVGMDVSGSAATIEAARRLIAEQMPPVALVDVNLHGEMACGLIGELHDQGVRVIDTSGYANPPVPMHSGGHPAKAVQRVRADGRSARVATQPLVAAIICKRQPGRRSRRSLTGLLPKIDQTAAYSC